MCTLAESLQYRGLTTDDLPRIARAIQQLTAPPIIALVQNDDAPNTDVLTDIAVDYMRHNGEPIDGNIVRAAIMRLPLHVALG